MTDYEASTYGDRIADVYDQWVEDMLPTATLVERLHELAAGGPVLELGVGTGRLAVPLAERGLEVHGIEASERMVARLREKPGGDRVDVIVGDLATADAHGSFSLVYAIGDTLNMLDTQDDQRRCVERFAASLRDAGLLVVEGYVPDRSAPGGGVSVQRIEPDEVRLFVVRDDPSTQTMQAAHVILREDGVRIYPGSGRYVRPAELDLMARLAGLRLRERWGGWNREPFTAHSRRHVSIYERAASV